MNLCLLSSKQETNINNNKKPSHSSKVFLSLVYYIYVSLIDTETLNLKQFWICVKLGQVWSLKVDETVHLSYFKQAAELQFIWLTQ